MKISISAIALAAALSIGLASPGSAHQETAGKLKIGHPWIREAAAGAQNTYACIIEIENVATNRRLSSARPWTEPVPATV